MMFLIPYNEFTVKTDRTALDVLSDINNRTSKFGATFLGFEPVREFRGVVTENSFKIEKRLDYHNSFNPQIEGHIKESEGITTLSVVLRLKELVEAFLFCWIAVLTIVCIGLYLANSFQFELIGFLLFAPLIAVLGFSREASKVKARLIELVESS
ncbi:hypothetical protein Q4574_11080 [Aliiglaciecola sp. 3_MG-2023]|uniref:hypothetical protein n=1 Tax=Aliiglaciecola sp. 3_MG-2023 TaxID=3062644 RepID=UPI0026E41AFF|nr:hypothetical protein [Aliiglaciecola sp. 3_MG-2023]MDO6693832.1 hypothetical protein [Aliiglaciecola sp. 3_MG-2023]